MFNFRSLPQLQKFFNHENFPDYGATLLPCSLSTIAKKGVNKHQLMFAWERLFIVFSKWGREIHSRPCKEKGVEILGSHTTFCLSNVAKARQKHSLASVLLHVLQRVSWSWVIWECCRRSDWEGYYDHFSNSSFHLVDPTWPNISRQIHIYMYTSCALAQS